jgi:hypothetical protein
MGLQQSLCSGIDPPIHDHSNAPYMLRIFLLPNTIESVQARMKEYETVCFLFEFVSLRLSFSLFLSLSHSLSHSLFFFFFFLFFLFFFCYRFFFVSYLFI